MKISHNWLSNYIDTGLTPQQTAEKLTSVGLEVEGLEHYSTLPKGIENLVVGHVLELKQHPNADLLKLTKVDVGNGNPLSIVCGAPNVAAGQKVIVAREGVTVNPLTKEPFTIKKSKIRGEFSEGMLCAEDEIGLGESHAGLLILDENAIPGEPIAKYLNGYEDWILEIGLTPNRVDAASHIGVARDLAALLDKKIKYPYPIPGPEISLEWTQAKEQSLDLNIKIEDTEACPRYSGMIVKGVQVKDSPEWLQNYLNAVGLNPINNIVDATNFVLHEMGQPIHAFDLSKIEGNQVIIRKSVPGSSFTTLDKQERKLDGTELMICNAKEPMAMAGIFGGLKSGISASTKDIFIESAYFNPSVIRRASRKHQLFTDASFRYERGADPGITITAAKRVATLIREIAGGDIMEHIYNIYPEIIKPVRLKFEFKYLNGIAGMKIPISEVKNILEGLEFTIIEEDQDGLLLEVPGFKTDVKRPVDVVEEVLRIYSFDKIPVNRQVKSIVQVDRLYHAEKQRKKISSFLIDHGFYETYMLSFVKEEENRIFKEKQSIPVINPISADIGFVKNNILVPGLRALQYNLNRQRHDLKIFNWDNVHSGDKTNFKQEYRLGLWITGNTTTESWKNKPKKVDFFDLKSMVEKILALSGQKDIQNQEIESSMFSYGLEFPGSGQKSIATIGRLSDLLLKKMDIGQEVFYAEFDAKSLLKAHKPGLKYEQVSKFPKVERDLAMIVPEDLAYSSIRNLVEKTENKILKRVSIFDVYKGNQVGEGFKSYAVRMEFEDKTQTLEDKTVDKVIQKIVYRLENELGVKIRS